MNSKIRKFQFELEREFLALARDLHSKLLCGESGTEIEPLLQDIQRINQIAFCV